MTSRNGSETCKHGHKPGDEVIISGDSARWGHGVKAGETRILGEKFYRPGEGDEALEGWETTDHWAIACIDMLAEVTEEEEQATIESIMKVST